MEQIFKLILNISSELQSPKLYTLTSNYSIQALKSH